MSWVTAWHLVVACYATAECKGYTVVGGANPKCYLKRCELESIDMVCYMNMIGCGLEYGQFCTRLGGVITVCFFGRIRLRRWEGRREVTRI